MTETEWLAATDPRPMLLLLKGIPKTRKFRLFGVACVNLCIDAADPFRQLAAVVEHYADDENPREPFLLRKYPHLGTEHVIAAMALTNEKCDDMAAIHIASWVWFQSGAAGVLRGTKILRDIFGNPFRPVAFAPEWRTGTAASLARGMYESRDFSAMPILADALQDAGCDSDDILNHCRDASATHVRGCWVVDLVLGNE